MRKSLAWAAGGLTIAATLLAVMGAASPGSAAAAPGPRAPTTLSVHQAAVQIMPGRQDVISGTLMSGRAPVRGQPVTLYTVNGRFTQPVSTERTGFSGGVAYTVTPRVTTTYELVFAGTRTLQPTRSWTVTVRVAPIRVPRPAPPAPPRAGHPVSGHPTSR